MKRILLLFALCLTLSPNLYAQSIIRGNVRDDKESLIGVAVIISGTSIGTTTDFNGDFEISAKSGDTLNISYIGYTAQDIVVSDSASNYNIVLTAEASELDEIVVIGYSAIKKSDLTGAVTSVKADQLTKTPASGVDQALQGVAAGVTVNANSGQPGAAAEVRIRGIGTINDSSPLYVVDGVMVGEISFLSPSDIQSMEILKDASATAIYGSRGANGVILITTKKGTKGRNDISFNASIGIQNRWKKLDLMGRDELASTIIKMNGVKSEMDFYNNNGFGKWLSAYRLGSSPYYPTNYDYATTQTDWQDEVFKENAIIQRYDVSFSGATDKSNYAISSSYFNQDGTIIGSNYERITVRVNTSFKVKDWLKIGENLSYVSSNGRNAMNNSDSPGASILSAALAMAPWDPTHYSAGTTNAAGDDLSGMIAASSNFKNVINPYTMVDEWFPEQGSDRLVGDAYLELTPIKHLTIKSSVSLDFSLVKDQLFKNEYEYSSFDKSDKNFFSSAMSRYYTLMNENIITYQNDFGKHSLLVMGGQTVEQYNYYAISGAGSSILNPVPSNWLLSQTTEDRTYASDAIDRARRLSFLSRVHYTFDNRFMLTATMRADASSKFNADNMWGYFPSIAAAWRVSQEDWMQSQEVLDDLKFRFGWGQIGNDKVGSNSFVTKMFNSGPTFVDYVFGANQTLANGAAILTFANEGGRWETTQQINAGVDFTLLNSKLSGSIDIYQRDTKDMLLSVTTPAQVGNRYDPQANVGTVRNTGAELALTYRNNVGDLFYNIGGNISYVKNRLTALNDGAPIYTGVQVINQDLPLYTFWGYEYEGIYKTDSEAQQHLYYYNESELPVSAGDAKFRDISGDGKIDDDDKTNLGNPFPDVTYGITLGAEYKGIDFSLFFQGVSGNEIYNAQRIRTEGKGTEATLSTAMRDVWSIDNPYGSIPNPYGTSMNYATSSRFIEDGSYLRLKNLQIGYTLPKSLTNQAKINRVRFYFAANNLLTFTSYSGYDPEVASGVDYGNYPQSRSYTFGVNLDF